MRKKVFCAVLLLALMLGMCTPAFAQVDPDPYDGNYEALFGTLDAEESYYMTHVQMQQYLAEAFELKDRYEDMMDVGHVGVTWKELLKFYCGKDLPFILQYGMRFRFIGGFDEDFPEQMWSYITEHSRSLVRIGEARKFVEAIQAKREHMIAGRQYADYDSFVAHVILLDDSFGAIAEGAKEAAEYYMEAEGKNPHGTTLGATILHELQHEMSARKSDSFSRREYKANGGAEVTWSGSPTMVYYYDLLTDEWVGVTRWYTPASECYVILPDGVAEMSMTESYYSKDSAMANSYGCYGILQELVSYTISARYNLAYAMMNVDDMADHGRLSRRTGFNLLYMYDYMLAYMSALKSRDPEIYQGLMDNGAFVKIYRDTCMCVEDMLCMYDVFYPYAPSLSVSVFGAEGKVLYTSEEHEILREWLLSDSLQAARRAAFGFRDGNIQLETSPVVDNV